MQESVCESRGEVSGLGFRVQGLPPLNRGQTDSSVLQLPRAKAPLKAGLQLEKRLSTSHV